MNTQAPSTPLPKEKLDEKERKSKYKFQADSLSKAKKAIAGTPTEPSRNVPGKPLVDFFIFAKFPAEIQDEVWETVCFQDTPTISIIVEQASIKMIGPLPKFPYFLHATSGARGIGLRYYEVLTSFDIFDREYRAALNLQAVATNAPNTWLAPPGVWAPAAGVLGHGPGAQVGLHGQTNQAAQVMINSDLDMFLVQPETTQTQTMVLSQMLPLRHSWDHLVHLFQFSISPKELAGHLPLQRTGLSSWTPFQSSLVMSLVSVMSQVRLIPFCQLSLHELSFRALQDTTTSMPICLPPRSSMYFAGLSLESAESF